MIARNDRRDRIPYTGGSTFGSNMLRGSSLPCASCHGEDGRGGVHMMHMQVMDAPDIHYVALTSEEGDDHGEDSHADEHSEYDLEDFRQAVIYGKHPNGAFLSSDMPRWKIGEWDLKVYLILLNSYHKLNYSPVTPPDCYIASDFSVLNRRLRTEKKFPLSFRTIALRLYSRFQLAARSAAAVGGMGPDSNRLPHDRGKLVSKILPAQDDNSAP